VPEGSTSPIRSGADARRFRGKAYELYQKELRPLGFKLHPEIVSFPEGMLGDVGLFLKWLALTARGRVHRHRCFAWETISETTETSATPPVEPMQPALPEANGTKKGPQGWHTGVLPWAGRGQGITDHAHGRPCAPLVDQ
jgi:hypothetical protein